MEMDRPTRDDVEPLVDHLFRHQSGRIVAALTRAFGAREIELIEDAVQEALVRALRLWPYRGIPDRPEAWLMTVARNRALDVLRRRTSWRDREDAVTRHQVASHQVAAAARGGVDGAPDGDAVGAGDDELTMVLLCCHPALPRDAQVALTLKTVAGFGVAEIARAFLAKEATVAQRLVRAKRRLQELDPAFSLPPPHELDERIDVALEILYLLFNEGYATHQGDELVRRDLCHEAIRLVELITGDARTSAPAASALAALFCFQAARLPARVDAAGEPLPHSEQDASRWDQDLVRRGLRHLDRSARGERVTPYHLLAEIASCYALPSGADALPSGAGDVDWKRIVTLYDELLTVAPSPVSATNRAVALAELEGAEGGLAALDALGDDPSLVDYAPYHLARGELAACAGRLDDARRQLKRAWELSRSVPVRRRLARRLRELGAES